MLKASSEDKKAYKKNSQPDWQGMYEELPSFLQSTGSESGTPSEAYSWLMEPVDVNGKVASRPAVEEDEDDEEVSDENLRDENSLTGLTGCDGRESTMYYWVLRKFVYDLNKRILMRGTKEKNDMLKAVPQTAQQGGVAFVRSCKKRFRLLSSTKDTVTGDIRRRAIDECVSLFRIKLFRDRVNENLRAQFPAGKGDLEWKDLEDIVRVQDKIKDEVEEWSMSIVQDLLRRQSYPYSVYVELKNFGIDLNAVVAAIRAAESKKIAAKEKPSDSKPPTSTEGGGTGEHSSKQVKYQKGMTALAEARTGAGTGGNRQVPPPSNYSPKGRKPCSLCNGGYAHSDREEDYWVGGKNSKCPADYTVSRINSARPDVRQNAQMRIYNEKYRFPRNLQGITTKD
ncbi:hypothetical protein CYMTET_17687 [Cymbomonas tetramitiformis]|uniref:VHS domain-containing protein n=1 Tax=Cymbomonas tetramitiformis TaxID=36881 RepID=A0AAE0L6W0_9CHLO|nr:hypothetical protein CYMTET_17687 [Cymbomonas tetramitiformis]